MDKTPLYYIGDCRTILDHSNVFQDATDMAQVVEKAKPIAMDSFISRILFSPITLTKSLQYTQSGNIVIVYDLKSDIHYFWEKQ